MKTSKIRFITTTAMLLALTIVFQMLRVIIPVLQGNALVSQLIIGSLVNLCLIVAAAAVGIWSGIIISVTAPIIANFTPGGALPFPWLIPFIIIGNALIVITYALLRKKSQILGFLAGGAVKTAFLWIGIVWIGISLFNVPEAGAKALSLNFTWPQMITATIGGLISLPVVRALKLKKAD